MEPITFVTLARSVMWIFISFFIFVGAKDYFRVYVDEEKMKKRKLLIKSASIALIIFNVCIFFFLLFNM